VNVRTRLKMLAGIGAVVGPLLFVWILCRSGESTFTSKPSATPREKPPTPQPVVPVAMTNEKLTLDGEVMDREGRPVAEARVTLVDPEGRGDVLSPGRSRDFRDRETQTDAAGRFRFEGMTAGKRSLVALAPDRAPAWTEPFLLDRSVHRTLTLPAPVTVTGLTHPGARLWFACRLPGVPSTGHEPFGRKIAADETGAFRVDGLPPSVAFTVRAEATGYRPRTFGPYQLPAGRHFIDFELDTGLALNGTVRDRAGRPVAGAKVTFDDGVAIAGADGTFQLSGLEERSSTLIVSREGYIQTVVTAVRPGSVEVTLPRAAEVSGRVRDERARYLCFTLGDARYRMGLSASETFRIPAVPPGPLRLDIEDADCRPLGSILVDAPEGGSVEGVEIFAR
jgi:protocatechuate 3,4-dioxygenase beta subunit